LSLIHFNFLFRASNEHTKQLVLYPETKLIPHDVLMLWGDKDPALMPETPEMESTLISGKIKIVHFPNASHNLHQQEKKLVWEEMIAFLTKPERK
jgi:pimeloyl-ACP methyl ester carboxylesterase